MVREQVIDFPMVHQRRQMFDSLICRIPERAGEDEGYDIGPILGLNHSNFSQLVSNATSCSPFLRSVAVTESDWVAGLAERQPEEALSELLETGPLASPGRTAARLRKAKRRMSLLVALADLGGVWPLGQVMRSITDFADFAVQECLQSLIVHAQSKGEMIGQPDVSTEELGGLFVLAMGKMGAFELNYSSDIDLIVFYDDQGTSTREAELVRSRFVRIVRNFVALMGTRSEDGYVFRTDLRLRPDPLVTPVCMPAQAAERYYESFGRTWERAAFIKARPCAGSHRAAAEFLKVLEPFVWRRNLDFASVEDARNIQKMIKSRIEYDSGGLSTEINVKLGRGGIRDIEMMTQSVQIIAGGRDSELRVADTLGGLSSLCSKRLIDEDVKRRLNDGYIQLREIEHRLQMINDAQTHSIPRNIDDLRRVAALCGDRNPEAFVARVKSLLGDVDGITGEFFDPERQEWDSPQTDLFNQWDRTSVERWRKLPALRNERANAVFSRILPKVISGLARAENPDQSMRQFGDFLKGLPAGVQLFSLFESNPVLIDLLTDICSTAPGLANYLSLNSQVFDAVLDGEFFDGLETTEALATNLQANIDPSHGFESVLDACRRWMKEQHFRVGVQHLRGIAGWKQAAEGYARIAETILICLWPCVVGQFSARHGKPPGHGAAVIGMGSMGSGLLTAQSDLDLIVIYDCGNDEVSTGPKPLAARKYYARLTQALVSALSVRTAEGRLYSIDMRLRPSGMKGPVATSLSAFKAYQREKAWTWEHMALIRGRYIVGSIGIGNEFERFRQDIINIPRETSVVFRALMSMRKRLAENTPNRRENDPWEVRLGQGRILDIELTAQAAALLAGCCFPSVPDQIEAGLNAGTLSCDEADRLNGSYLTLRRMLQVARLTVKDTFEPESAGEGAVAFLLRETGEESIDCLKERLSRERRDCRTAINLLVNRLAAAGEVS